MSETVGAQEMRDRKILSDSVGTDLSRNEQETGISFFGDAERFKITTYSSTMVRSLLEHSEARIEWLYVEDAAGQYQKVDSVGEVRDGDDRAQIEGICATLPLGTLSIKGSTRASNRHSHIITTPEDIEGLSEEFEGGEE